MSTSSLDQTTATSCDRIGSGEGENADYVSSRASRIPVYLVVGNHNSFDGIYDIVHILNGVLSKHYDISISYGIRPGYLNVLIDEFSSEAICDYLVQAKRECASTRLVVVATEFVTPITLLGLRLGLSFNLTSSYRNLWTNAISHFAAQSIPRFYPYMHSRFRGFSEVLKLADLVVSIAPAVGDSLSLLRESGELRTAILYPEIELDFAAVSETMRNLPFGFVLTGTLTKYRTSIIDEMNWAFRKYRSNVFSATRFSDSQGPGRSTQFSYPYKSAEVLFNLNPPQQRLWRWSSPVRIYRAAILGQIPVLTKVFGDHEIEDIAAQWKGSSEDTSRLFVGGTLGRAGYVDAFLQRVASYNEIARQKNRDVLGYFSWLASGEFPEPAKPFDTVSIVRA